MEEISTIENTRILIIDDDLNIREAYRKILTPSNLFSEHVRTSNAFSQSVHTFPWKEYGLTLTTRGEEGIQAVEQAVEQEVPTGRDIYQEMVPGA